MTVEPVAIAGTHHEARSRSLNVPVLVHAFLDTAAARSPEATALIEPNRSITYGELDRLANRFANLFRGEGVRRGDRVVLALENSIELVAGYFGAMKAGAVAVPLPPGPKSDRLARAVQDCTPGACVVDSALARDAWLGNSLAAVPSRLVHNGIRSAREAQAGGGSSWQDLHTALDGASADPPDVRAIDLDLAAIVYTSGSTGAPRGVMLSHRNIVSNTRSIVRYLSLTAQDRAMCVLPFYYVYGLSVLHTHVSVAGSVVIDNRFAFPNVVLNAIQQHRVTGFAGVPSTFALLLHRSNLADMSFPALRYATQAGGGMPPAQLIEWLERGPRVPFYVMYGATEASARLTYLDPADLRRKLGSIGKAIPNVELLVVKDDGQVAAPREIGELVARGANIFRGYWNNPEATHEALGPRGCRTGDLGYADEEGFLFLVGRRHDIIKVGAHRVGAKEIEDVLHEYPGVHEVAVVATPHELLGEAPVAFIAMQDEAGGANAEALQAFCRERLTGYKVPVRIVFRSELPKLGGVGKIDKGALRELVSQGGFA